jgi:hypothetical protein
MKYIYFLCIAIIAYGVYLFSAHLLHGDLLFHTDIARDFLLIQDIVINHKLTLLGPRAGGIPGTYFGPIWLYLNIPAFFIGNGNPIVVGYFWLFLMILGLGITFYVSWKIFNFAVGLFASAILIYTVLFLAPGFTQSFAPIVFSPVLLYTMYLFIEKKRIRYLCWSAFLSGLLIQFQPAFGSIILFITFVLSLVILIRRKQLKYQLVWFIAFIPLSTYVVFELRHNFLETRALYNFIFHHNSSDFAQVTYPEVAHNRLDGFLDSINLINISTPIINLFFVLLNAIILYIWCRTKKSGQRTFVLLVYLYFMGFWLVTFLFKGTVWNYYYWGLYPLLSISLGSLYLKINKRIFLILFSILLFFMIRDGNQTINYWQIQVSGIDTSSWIVNLEVADYIYHDANQNFGYYVYSPDVFGYSKKYAMSYVNLTGGFPEKGSLCTKKPITYLIYEATSPESHTDPVFWKEASVSIKTKPIETKIIQGIKIEKYELTPKQVANPSDPTMICGLQWR